MLLLFFCCCCWLRAWLLTTRYGHALQEAYRRQPFAEAYEQLGEEVVAAMSAMRRDELQLRAAFQAMHEDMQPNWPAFVALQDHPHSCVAKFRPSDQALPRLSFGAYLMQK